MLLCGSGANGWNVIYDAIREQRFERPDGIENPYVRPGRWLVQRNADRQRHREQCLFDPTTGACSPLPESVAKAEFCTVVDDGRMLALLHVPADPRRRTLAFVDPESGACEAVELPPWFGGELHSCDVTGRTPDGALVVALRDADRKKDTCYARLDLAARRLVAARGGNAPYTVLLGCPDEETLILVEGGRRLIRAHFGGARTELLFPRPRP
jgi:hypothetical protein